MTPRVISAALMSLWPSLVVAHTDSVLSWWNLDPWVVVPLTLAGVAYARGVHRLWHREVGRGVARWQVTCFAAGMAGLFVALIYPLDALASSSFSAHMTQHMILMVLAAPLIILSAPLVVFLAALPVRARARFARAWRRLRRTPLARLSTPMGAFCVHSATIWVWHAPGAFEAALAHEWLHITEHVLFLGTGLLFWSAMRFARQGTARFGAGSLWLLAMVMHTGLLGALLTFARTPLYPHYRDGVAFGLSPLEDQQLAGLIMWIPGGLVYLIAGLALVAAWLDRAERRARMSIY